MTLNKISILTAICVLGGISNAFASNTATSSQTATVTPKCSIECGSLKFGNIAYTGSGTATITVPADGSTASSSSSTTHKLIDSQSRGTCTIKCPTSYTKSNASLTVENSSNPTKSSSTISVTPSLNSSTVSISSGSGTFYVGGTAVIPANAATGEYTAGSYSVTLTY